MSTAVYERRMLLRGFLSAGCALLLQSKNRAEAAGLSKEEAQYQDKPKGEQHCDNCMHFIGPNACAVVEGSISPSGWYRLWVRTPG